MIKNKGLLFIALFFTFLTFSQEDLFSSTTLPEHLKSNANAVVRLNSLHVLIDSQRDMTMTINRIVTVLNEKGSRIVNAGSGYDNFLKIKKIEAVVYNDAGAEIKKFKKKDFIDHSAVDGGTLYSDSRVLFMGYTPVSYPYTVSFTCEIQTPNTAAIPSWKPIDDYFVSVEKDVYQVQDLAGIGLKSKEKNLEAFSNIKTDVSDSQLIYSIENIPVLKPEDLSPSMAAIMPQVLVAAKTFHFNGVDGAAENWNEYGEWIRNKLLLGRDEVTEETKQKVKSLVAGIEDPIERARLVYKFVQDNLRYISVQVGIGGIQPIEALEVDKLKYGDCKGLTNYTKSLLKIAGVESYYCVVEAGKEIVDFEDDFPTLAQGNHIILCIPDNDKNIWLDCTSQIHPFGFIGDFTDSRKVLIVKENGSEIAQTTIYPDSINYQSIEAKIDLREDASIFSRLKIASKGIQYDNKFFIETGSDKDIKDFYKSHWGYVNNLEIQNYQFTNDKDRVIFNESLSIAAMNYASVVGNRMLFTINVFNKSRYVPDRYKNRKLPFEIQRGYLDEDNFEIVVPGGYEIESLPENMSVSNKYGDYSLQFEKADGKVFYKRKLLIKKGVYPKEEYKLFREFKKSVVSGDNLKIVLKKSV